MQTMFDVVGRPVVPITPTVRAVDAQAIAHDYVATYIDPSFTVVADRDDQRQPLRGENWRFFICCQDGPLRTLEVNIQSGKVIPLTSAEICVTRQKAAIFAARKQGILPVDSQGYVLAEYARRQASSYLDEQISMFYSGTDPIFVTGNPPIWQITIVFKMAEVGPFTVGVIDVDAQTGKPIPLSTKQIKRIRECTRAIIRHQTPTTAAG